MESDSNRVCQKALDEHVAELMNSEHENLPDGFYNDVGEIALAATRVTTETPDSESNKTE